MSKRRQNKRETDPRSIAKYYCKQKADQSGFQKLFINDNIGFGVFATKTFQHGEFLLEYAGNCISKVEGEKLQSTYPDEAGSFLFFYNNSCIDATENTQFGKYVNDSKNAKNCCMKPIYDDNGHLHLCLFVLCDKVISIGEELRYSYGDMKELFWRKNKETASPYFANIDVVTKQGFVLCNPGNVINNQKKQIYSEHDDEFISGSATTEEDVKECLDKIHDCILQTEVIDNGENDEEKCDQVVVWKKDGSIELKSDTCVKDKDDVNAKFIDVVDVYEPKNNDPVRLYSKNVGNGKDSVAINGQNVDLCEKLEEEVEENIKCKGFNGGYQTNGATVYMQLENMGGEKYCVHKLQLKENVENTSIIQDMEIVGENKEQVAAEIITDIVSVIDRSVTNDKVLDFVDVCEPKGNNSDSLHNQSVGEGKDAVLVNRVAGSVSYKVDNPTVYTQVESNEGDRYCGDEPLHGQNVEETNIAGIQDMKIGCENKEQVAEIIADVVSVQGRNYKSADVVASGVNTYKNSTYQSKKKIQENIGSGVNKKNVIGGDKFADYYKDIDFAKLDCSDDDVKITYPEIEIVPDFSSSDSETCSILNGSNEETTFPLKINFRNDKTETLTKVLEKFMKVDLEEIETLASTKVCQVAEHTQTSREVSCCEQVSVKNDSGLEIDEDLDIVNTDSEQETIEAESKKLQKKSPYKKPYRMCIYCSIMSSKLSRHIKKCHKENERVKNALKMTKVKQIEEWKKIKREGILMYNKLQATTENPIFQGERQRKKYLELQRCNLCSAFISKRFFASHKRTCMRRQDAVPTGLPLSLDFLPMSLQMSDQFKEVILAKLRDDPVGNICRKDEMILRIGMKLFAKLVVKKEKAATVNKSVRGHMRVLGSLYQSFKRMNGVCHDHGNLLDMFVRKNFTCFTDAIDAVTLNVDRSLKPGLRQNVFYIINKSVKILYAHQYMLANEEEASEIEKFMVCYKANEDCMVSSARYELEKKRLVKIRKPCQLPLESDIEKIHQHILKRMGELLCVFELWTAHSFVELRNLVLTRLTLLNGRRGGETSRLLVKDWLEAESDNWIDQQRLQSLNEADKLLVSSLKITYMTGKGNHHLVSVLFPNDTTSAMKRLVDPKFRIKAGIDKNNDFVFASTQLSSLNVSGWHALKEVCKKLELTNVEIINATTNRHRVSTLYAALDLPQQERQLFYAHMGHSESMNKDIYQAPLALMGVTKIGKQLINLHASDNGHIEETDKSLKTFKDKTHTEDKKLATNYAVTSTPVRTSAEATKTKRSVGKRVMMLSSSSSDEEAIESKNVPVEARKYPLRGRSKKRKKYVKITDAQIRDDSCDPTSYEDKEENERLKCKPVKSSVKWTPELNKVFFEKFGCYVRRTNDRPFPGRLEMENFAKSYFGSANFAFAVRTKINNERKKFDDIKNKRLKEIGLTS
ncbi:uncharacterized protein LOC130649644 isoform X1 [Hydractinia symbiolongicarpus]|uniref:uncharacterized protein LOC130649644 isoform X1 n=1 Tax=Hydractinia symbiolongicarpus TaxID=13093 RepID=UPI0025519E7D|nr:uncharacterized protein LOC130649644 isoform X1 [Hydractinia symbiolongicarpus]